MRRIPTQLLESAAAVTIGLVALAIAWTTSPQPSGALFTGAIAAYTPARQVLFPLRAGPRHTAHGRTFAMALARLVLAAAIVAVLVR